MIGNIKIKEKEGGVVLDIDYTPDPKPSTSGKSKVLASTQGFITLDKNGTGLNLNITKK